MDWLNVLLKCAQWSKHHQNRIIFSAGASFSLLRLLWRNQRVCLGSVLSIQNWLNFAKLNPFHGRATCYPVCINAKVAKTNWHQVRGGSCAAGFPADASIVLFVSEARTQQLFPRWLDGLAVGEIACTWVSWGLTTSLAAWAAAKLPF